MAGTCPNCGIKIAGQLRTCPECGSYCLLTQETCPECGNKLEPQTPSLPSSENEKEEVKKKQPPRKKKKKKKRACVGCLVGTVLVLALCAAGYYYYDQHRRQQEEQNEYEQLANITYPEFYQQFLDKYPESQYFDEIHERMLVLQEEAKDWEQLQKRISRKNVNRFLENHPNTLRARICEDMLDSIDWQDALANGSEEAMTDYLAKHPSGSHVNEAADMKNSLLLTKVTPEERAMIRGTLEAFFSKAIANQDLEAAQAAIPDTTMHFCGNPKADAEAIVQYARDKMAKDVIGLHYLIGEKISVHKETLSDGNMGFSVDVSVQETINRSDTNQPASNLYRVTAKLNQEQKIVRMNISK